MMHMDVLRCQSPDMVRKEIWAHLLAYNLIRTVIAQAAAKHGKHPASDQLHPGHADLGSLPLDHWPIRSSPQLATLYEHMLQAIAYS